MTSIFPGDIVITKYNVNDWLNKYRTIKHITGSLSIQENVELNGIKSVGKDLYIHYNVNAILNNLLHVGRDYFINGDAKVKSGDLKIIGRDLFVGGLSKLQNLGPVKIFV